MGLMLGLEAAARVAWLAGRLHVGPRLAALRIDWKPRQPQAVPAGARTHRATSGDCVVGIARQHGVSVYKLLAANPQLRARGLPAGTLVQLP